MHELCYGEIFPSYKSMSASVASSSLVASSKVGLS